MNTAWSFFGGFMLGWCVMQGAIELWRARQLRKLKKNLDL